MQSLSQNAPTPDGYNVVFTGKDGSLSASRYMGLYTIDSFDTLTCASKCDRAAGCQAFNMYIERDPSLDPNTVDCPNPPSTTNYKCTLWGAPVAVEQAKNKGQWRASFQVVITGSNGTYPLALPILQAMVTDLHQPITSKPPHHHAMVSPVPLPLVVLSTLL